VYERLYLQSWITTGTDFSLARIIWKTAHGYCRWSSAHAVNPLIFCCSPHCETALSRSSGVNLESHSYQQQGAQQQWVSLARASASVQHWAGTFKTLLCKKTCLNTTRQPRVLKTSLSLQFDKVQENFSSLEQQTSTFQAHLEGLGKGNQDRHVGPLAGSNVGRSNSASPQTSPHVSDASLERSTSDDSPLTLCERSALQFSSTFGRLRISGKKKWFWKKVFCN